MAVNPRISRNIEKIDPLDSTLIISTRGDYNDFFSKFPLCQAQNIGGKFS